MLRRIVVPVFSALLLAGCGAAEVVTPADRSIAMRDTEIHTVAAGQVDAMMKSMATKCEIACNAGDTILYATLSPIDDLNVSSRFGRIYAEHAADRLVQRGYNVGELRMRESMSIGNEGEFVLSRKVQDLVKERQAAAIMAGTYAVADSQVLVSMRLLDASSGRIIAADSTSLPIGANTLALLNNSPVPSALAMDRAHLVVVADVLSSASTTREADQIANTFCGGRGQLPVGTDTRVQFRQIFRAYDCAPIPAYVDPTQMK